MAVRELSQIAAGNVPVGTDNIVGVQAGPTDALITFAQASQYLWASPTFTGTVTAPDAGTWGSSGISLPSTFLAQGNTNGSYLGLTIGNSNSGASNAAAMALTNDDNTQLATFFLTGKNYNLSAAIGPNAFGFFNRNGNIVFFPGVAGLTVINPTGNVNVSTILTFGSAPGAEDMGIARIDSSHLGVYNISGGALNGLGYLEAALFYTNNASFILASLTTITGGGTGNTPTLTAGPVNGNPTKWLPYYDNGTTCWIPAWSLA